MVCIWDAIIGITSELTPIMFILCVPNGPIVIIPGKGGAIGCPISPIGDSPAAACAPNGP